MYWYLKVIKNYAGFTGRARRREYWMFILVHILISLVLFGGDLMLRGGLEHAMAARISLSGLYGWAVLIPSIAVQARRLHDLDRSGWWLLLILVPQAWGWTLGLLGMFGVEELAGLTAPDHPAMFVAGVLIMAGSLVLFIFYCMRGTSGSNRYGPDPLGGSRNDEIWPEIA